MSITLYVDMRCLQDPNYSFRGIGHHSGGILKNARKFIPEISDIIGIIDPDFNPLPEPYRNCVDRVIGSFNPDPRIKRGLFLELSPMTHNLIPTMPLLKNINIFSVTLIYDFIPLDFDTNRYLCNFRFKNQYYSSLRLLNFFDNFIPISEYSNSRLQFYTGITPEKCCVSGVAVRKKFESDSSELSCRPEILSLAKRKYYFATLGDDIRKNPFNLLEALARCNLHTNQKTDLIIVGHYPIERINQLTKFFQDHNGNPDCLHFLNQLSDDEIRYLNHNSICAISPSFIEGFSIPVLEAICSGTPIFVSDIDAHRELIPFSEYRFNPNNPDELAKLLIKVSQDKDFRDQIIHKQSALWKRFTEENVTQRAWSFIRSNLLIQSGPQLLRSKSHLPRVAFLTPYPPEKSGVADYTAQSLSEISNYAVVDVFTTCKNPRPDPWVNAFYPISSAPYMNGKYDIILPIIGNSHFHINALELHRCFGGPCLIHDNRLAELYAWWKGIDYFRKMAEKLLNKHFSIEECQSWLSQPWKLPSLYFEDILYRASPVIFHSKGIQRYVRKLYNYDSEYLPFCCYRSFNESELTHESRISRKKKLGLQENQIVISTFGFVGQTKGPEDCIWTIDLLRSWGINVHFYFVGAIESQYQSQLMTLVNRLNLSDQIHFFSDWISDHEYKDYIIASDYAIQLRTHGFGGLSGAMLDCIGSGLPSVVNEDLAEALDSPHYILRVPDQFSPVLIAEKLFTSIKAGLHYTRLTQARHDYVQTHSFKNYAKQFVKVLGIQT